MKNMKQRLALLMVTILLSLVAFAQPPQPPRFNPAKFEADMEQFITTEVGLTPMEASRFFPLFREMQNSWPTIFRSKAKP